MRQLREAAARAEAAAFEDAVRIVRPWIADIGWLDAAIARECAAMAADPLHLPPFRTARSGGIRHLILWRGERVWISITLLDPAPGAAAVERVHFSGRYLLCRPLGGPMRGLRFVLGDDGRMRGGEPERHARGALVERDERCETLRILPGDCPLMLLRAQIAPPGPVAAAVHDVASGLRLATAEIDEGHARSLMMLTLLRLQGRRDAVPLFEAALDAPLPAQRWAVMREYLALDTARALPALRAMAEAEPAADIRALARQTLEKATGAQANGAQAAGAKAIGAPCPA